MEISLPPKLNVKRERKKKYNIKKKKKKCYITNNQNKNQVAILFD